MARQWLIGRVIILLASQKVKCCVVFRRQITQTSLIAAFEILGDPVKRRSYDSIDPTFDDEIPNKLSAKAKPETFFKTFGPAFELNAR